MKNSLWKKGIVIWTIFLFIGASVIPIINGSILEDEIIDKKIIN